MKRADIEVGMAVWLDKSWPTPIDNYGYVLSTTDVTGGNESKAFRAKASDGSVKNIKINVREYMKREAKTHVLVAYRSKFYHGGEPEWKVEMVPLNQILGTHSVIKEAEAAVAAARPAIEREAKAAALREFLNDHPFDLQSAKEALKEELLDAFNN
mgnify:CR=1 FL=1